MDESTRIAAIFEKYLARQCSASEFNELLAWMVTLSEPESDSLSGPMKALWEQARAGRLPSTADRVNWIRMYEAVMANREAAVIQMGKRAKRRIGWPRIAAASIVLFVLLGGSYFLFIKNRNQPDIAVRPAVPRLPEEVLPGMNKAILVLANGKQIILDSAEKGVVANQGNVRVIKPDSGSLTYTSPANVQAGAVMFNKVSTPRAAQYQLVLSDGSRVWLNAASSLRFPTSFPGKERRVELTGEGYFEVAHDASKPFHVSVRGMDVEVKGTHFNIMAYDDEPAIQTSLLEGSVAVNAGAKTSIIRPGEQASFNALNGLQTGPGNMSQAVAWKNGYFYFDKADVAAILRQVSRWYDLDIEYESPASADMLFSGKIERNLPLSGIARLLANGPIHFRIEGKRLIVMK